MVSTDTNGSELSGNIRGDTQKVESLTSGTPFPIDCSNVIAIAFSTVASKEIFFTRNELYNTDRKLFMPARCFKIPGKGAIIDVTGDRNAQIVLNIPSGTDTVYYELMLQDETQGA